MRIAHIHRSMGTGGIEAMICGLSNEMVKEHDVTVCTIVKPSSEDKFYKELSPAVHRETIGRVGKGKHLREIVRISRFVRDGQFDIVHLHCFFYYFVLAILLYHSRIVFCYTIHNDAYKENTPWDRRVLFFKKFCFRRKWVHPITISPISQSSFLDLYRCDSVMIPNGVVKPQPDGNSTVDLYRITDQTVVFIHAARICPQKNQVMLCRVFDRLIREGMDIVLVIAGPIHWHSIFAEMQTYFSDRIRHIGDRADIPALLCSADGMCLSSDYEGLPVVLLESVAAGCIPVCTPVGGIVNVINDGVDGILSENVSEDAYYQAMKRYLNLTEFERETMMKNCLEKSEEFSMRRCAQAYSRYYETLLRKVN